ncbi:MAG: hypothetical protein WCG04_00605 [Alphaproteobacteria bacterium]
MAFPLIATALALAEFAPSIARWLGDSQAQDVAQAVVDTAKRVTGAPNDAEAISCLQENPALVADFQRAILQIDADLTRAYLQDRQDARARDVALRQASGERNIRADIMVVSAALGLVFCLCSLAYYSTELPGEAVGIISTIAGIFGACLKDAYAFEFGSSRGSKDKDMAMATMLEKKVYF